MYCSGQVPFLPSLSPKILVGEGRIPGQARSRVSLLQEGFFLKNLAPQISPGLTPLLKLAFCKLWQILLTCPSQILLTDTACTLFALGPNEAATLVAKEGVPDHIFQAHGAWRSRPGTLTLRGLLPINCFQPGPCTTETRL